MPYPANGRYALRFGGFALNLTIIGALGFE